MSEPSDIDSAVAASLEHQGVKGGVAAEPETKPASTAVDYDKLAAALAAKLKPAESAPSSSDDEIADALRALAGVGWEKAGETR